MRLGRLPKDCATVARAVSVLGDGAELPVVAELTGLEDASAAAAVAVLARAELVRVDHPLGFVHPLVGEAVYHDLPPGERELAHERAAQVLARRGASAEQVAAQLMLAPHRGDPDTVRFLRLAAGTAAERGAADAASAYLERALAEPPGDDERAGLLLELGRLTTMIDGPKAVAALEAAYEALTEPAVKADVAIMLTRTLAFAEAPGRATAFARRALAELPDGLDDARQGLVALERIAAYMHGLPADEWLVGEPELRGEGTGARMLAATLAWEELIRTGDRHGASTSAGSRWPTERCSAPTSGCCGWSPRSCRRWPRRTWRRSGSRPSPRRTPAGRCSRRCRCTCGGATCSGTGGGCRRPSAR